MRYAKTLASLIASLGLGFWGAATEAEPVAVVSAKSPVSSLTRGQVADIFLGRMNRLPDGTPLVPFDQAEGSPLRDEFYTAMTGKSAAQLKAYWSKIIFTGRGMPLRQVRSNGEAMKLLAENPNAITYIDENAVDASLKVVPIAK